MPNFCAAPNCTRKSSQSDVAFFRFPRDPSRCQKWVENCRRSDLEDKTPDQLNKHYRLCAQHFEDSMICRNSPYRTVLRENAIPTIFDLTSHLGNPGRRRKRIKELSEDEIRSLKEGKRTEMVFGLPRSVIMDSKTFLDTELLIALVRLHPELYDPRDAAFHLSDQRLKLWNQISSEMVLDWDSLNPQQRHMKVREVQEQWQTLTENFRRELANQTTCRRGSGHSASPHFKDLLFLKPMLVLQEESESRGSPPTPCGMATEGDIKVVCVKEEPASPPDVTCIADHAADSPRSTPVAFKSPSPASPERDQEEDSHMDFAKSLVPYLSQVPDSHQANLRMALTNIIFCYIENTRGHTPTASPQLLHFISPQSRPLT